MIGQIAAKDKAAKSSKRKVFSDIQRECNETRKLMDESETALNDSLASTALDLLFVDVDAVKLTIRQQISNLDRVRLRIDIIHSHRPPVGMPADAGVRETLTYYSTTWIPMMRRGIVQLEDSVTGLPDSMFNENSDGTGETADELDDHSPLRFARLARKGRLTLKPGVRSYKGGKAYYFNETDAWTLHVHPNNFTGARAHYKPVEDELSVGYHDSNTVYDVTLLRLGVLDQ